MLKSGDFFYIGSSNDFKRRKADHQWRLRNNIHPVEKIQNAFNETGVFTFIPLKLIKRKPSEADADFRDRLRAEEQVAINELKNDQWFANKSMNSRGPEHLKTFWGDPDFRAAHAKRMSEMNRQSPSAETRAKMSEAKKGDRNPNARAIIITLPDGSEIRVSSVSDAAKFFNVPQQVMDLWMKKKVSWPGTGRPCRPPNRWIAEYSARYEDETV